METHITCIHNLWLYSSLHIQQDIQLNNCYFFHTNKMAKCSEGKLGLNIDRVNMEIDMEDILIAKNQNIDLMDI